MKTIIFCILIVHLQTAWANSRDPGVLIPAGAFQMGCSVEDSQCVKPPESGNSIYGSIGFRSVYTQ